MNTARSFATVDDANTVKKLVSVDQRTAEEEEYVLNYMGMVKNNRFRKSKFIEETKNMMIKNIFFHPSELSTALSQLYRNNHTKVVLQMYIFYERNLKFGLYNTKSIKYTMLCAAAEKDLKLLNRIYFSLTDQRREGIVISAIYIRCLLSLNQLKEATQFLKLVLDNPEYHKRKLVSNNDVYSNIIIGFYEGNYYTRCLEVFHSIRPLEQTTEIDKSIQLSDSWKPIQNSRCYSSVIGSYFNCGDYVSTIKYYQESMRMGLFPQFMESQMVAKSWELSEVYKQTLTELTMKKTTFPGIPESELPRYLLNVARIPQIRKSIQQVYWSWYYHRQCSPSVYKPKKQLILYCDNEKIPAVVSQCVGLIYDIRKYEGDGVLLETLLVKLKRNENGMAELVGYFEKEAYPLLNYAVEGDVVQVKMDDARKWVKERRRMGLELR